MSIGPKYPLGPKCPLGPKFPLDPKCSQNQIFSIFSEVGWFKRHTANTAHPSLQVQEGTNGTLNFKLSEGIKTTEKTISLGEEHSETLPNGESTRVSFF